MRVERLRPLDEAGDFVPGVAEEKRGAMARVARIVVAEVAHHVTQRGNGRQFGAADPDACLETSTWRRTWSETSWRKFLAEGETEAELRTLRRCTYTGRPLGPEEFTQALEKRTERRLTLAPRGRPRKIRAAARSLAPNPLTTTMGKAAY